MSKISREGTDSLQKIIKKITVLHGLKQPYLFLAHKDFTYLSSRPERERQFVTREIPNHNTLSRFEQLLVVLVLNINS